MHVNPENISDKPDDEFLKHFIQTSGNANVALGNQTRVASEIYLARTLENAVNNLGSAIDRMTESNVKLSRANEKHARS